MRNTCGGRLSVGEPQPVDGCRRGSPRKALKIITWNVGSLFTRKDAVLSILAVDQPHILLLQECRLRNGASGAFSCLARDAGYTFVPHSSNDLGAFVCRGLNLASVKPSSDDDQFTIARYALQLGQARFLLRHRHASPNSP